MALLEVGRLGRPHGLGGEMLVDLVTNHTERLAPGARLVARRANGDERTLTVDASRPHQGRYLVTFAEVASRSDAERLVNATLLAEPSPAVEGEIFVHELIGASVVDQGGTVRGTVVAVEANPASDLLVLDDGALVPMRFVERLHEGVVTVDVPDGLFG